METVFWKSVQEIPKDEDTFKEDSYTGEPVILESEVNATLKVLGR